MLFFIQNFRWCSPKRLTWLTHILIQLHTDVYPRLTALCPGLPGWAGTRKVKPILILLKQETMSGSGISWAICKSASRSRQITMPAPHHSVFLRAGCPSCRPTNSVKALKGCSRPVNQQKCKMYLDCIVWTEICSSWSLPLMYYLFVIAKFLSTCSHFWIISLAFSFVL